MPKCLFESFPSVLCDIIARYTWRLNQRAEDKMPRRAGKRLLVRLKTDRQLHELAGRRVLVVYARAKVAKDSTERRPSVTLRELEPHEVTDASASEVAKLAFYDFLLLSLQLDVLNARELIKALNTSKEVTRNEAERIETSA